MWLYSLALKNFGDRTLWTCDADTVTVGSLLQTTIMILLGMAFGL